MQFVTTKINTGKAKTFDEICADYVAKNRVKTASTEGVVKTAEEEQKSSGQLDVEPLHQKGESTNQPKGKSKGTDSEKTESSGQPEAEAKLVNDPKILSETEAESEEETKTAGIDAPGKRDGTGPFDPDATEEEKEDAKKNPGSRKGKRQKAGEECPFAKDDDKDDDKKEASSQKFVKIANLDEKGKKFLKDYWDKIYPPGFADAMLAEK